MSGQLLQAPSPDRFKVTILKFFEFHRILTMLKAYKGEHFVTINDILRLNWVPTSLVPTYLNLPNVDLETPLHGKL